jgi:hypothetical protein
MRPKDTSAISLGEFSTLVVEVFSCGDVMQEGPALLGGDETGGEDHGMEGDVVLAHELEEFDVLVDPPVLVGFLEEVGSDGDVPYGSVEPDIEDFLFELFDGDCDTPF